MSEKPGEREWDMVRKSNPSENLRIYYPDPFRKNFITGCFKTLVMKEGERPRLVELFWNNTGEGHYSAISDKSALLSKQMSGNTMRKCYFCDRCDNVFKSEKKRNKHQKNCFGLRTRKYKDRDALTSEPPKMKFRNIRGLTRIPSVCYGDGECNLKPEYIRKGNTKLVQEHDASCWGFHYIGPYRTKHYDFFPPNPTENFVKGLVEVAEGIFHKYWEPVVKTNLSPKQERNITLDDEVLNNKNIDYSCRYFLKQRKMPRDQKLIGDREKQNATHCYLCNVEFLPDDKKVIDHDHFSGKYLGIAHNSCNLQRKTRPEMDLFFHNANYDFVQLLPKFFKDLRVEIIPNGILKAGERFMALSLGLKLAKEVHQKKSRANL